MTGIEFVDRQTVEYIQHMGEDAMICNAARASTTQKFITELGAKDEGLIRRVVGDGHTSTLEHSLLTVRADVTLDVRSEWHRHRTQCISGETLITFSSGNPQGKAGSIGTTKKSIAEHYEHWHHGVPDTRGRRRILPSVKGAKVVSMNEETGDREFSTVLDVVQSGLKPVLRMTTASGKSAKATKDHKFLTPEGWFVLGDLSEGDELMVQHRGYRDRSEDRAVPWSLRQGINTWTSTVRKEVRIRDEGVCQSCGVATTEDAFRCDHRIPVVVDLEKALSISNLQTLCIDCDRRKTSSEQPLADRSKYEVLHFSPDPIVKIEPVGEEMTYDLVLDDPHHNFLGNGIVTHNSYNEVSGRFSEYAPRFYVEPDDRPLGQVGKSMDYKREHLESWARHYHRGLAEGASEVAWSLYQEELDMGVCREVARRRLPTNLMTQFYATANLNNWFKYLGLRNKPDALYEIREAADQVEAIIAEHWPVAFAEFNKQRDLWARFKEWEIS